MTLQLPVGIAVGRGFWQATDFPPPDVAPSILQRDQHTCRFCGWYCEEYQEVHHIDGDHTNHHADNLATICPLCHAAVHVGLTAAQGRARLIWEPRVPQHLLNHLALWLNGSTLFQGTANNPALAQSLAAEIKALIQKKTAQCEQLLQTADLGLLANRLLRTLSDEDFGLFQTKLAPQLRLWPLLEHYPPAQQAAWRTAMQQIAPDFRQAAVLIAEEKHRTEYDW